MGLAATSAVQLRKSPEIFSQGDREIGRSASENFGFTRLADAFAATQRSVDRWAGMTAADYALSEQVIAACIAVHREIGPGLLESIYEAALCEELRLRGLSFERQKSVSFSYKGKTLDQAYRVDLVVCGRLIVEVKTVDALLPIHAAQVVSYLRLTGIDDALLVNFNALTIRSGLRRLSRNPKISRSPDLPVKKSGSV
jgi:GxxExxY protein